MYFFYSHVLNILKKMPVSLKNPNKEPELRHRLFNSKKKLNKCCLSLLWRFAFQQFFNFSRRISPMKILNFKFGFWDTELSQHENFTIIRNLRSSKLVFLYQFAQSWKIIIIFSSFWALSVWTLGFQKGLLSKISRNYSDSLTRKIPVRYSIRFFVN